MSRSGVASDHSTAGGPASAGRAAATHDVDAPRARAAAIAELDEDVEQHVEAGVGRARRHRLAIALADDGARGARQDLLRRERLGRCPGRSPVATSWRNAAAIAG